MSRLHQKKRALKKEALRHLSEDVGPDKVKSLLEMIAKKANCSIVSQCSKSSFVISGEELTSDEATALGEKSTKVRWHVFFAFLKRRAKDSSSSFTLPFSDQDIDDASRAVIWKQNSSGSFNIDNCEGFGSSEEDAYAALAHLMLSDTGVLVSHRSMDSGTKSYCRVPPASSISELKMKLVIEEAL